MKKYAAHQQRVIDEMIQLDEKISLLQAFVKTSEIYKALPESERDLLLQQRTAMRAYSAILNQRIALFTPVEVEDSDEEEESPAVPLAPLFRAKFKVLQVISDKDYDTVVMASEDNPVAELTMAISDPQLVGAISPMDVFGVDFTLAPPSTDLKDWGPQTGTCCGHCDHDDAPGDDGTGIPEEGSDAPDDSTEQEETPEEA